MEIKDIKNHFNHIRKSKEMWNEFVFVYSENDDFGDANYLKRYALAIELQYSGNSHDKELVKFLMEQEIENRMNAPYQGIGESLNILSYLLAKFREPENVWLFEKAKCANYDTYCGYSSEFIFSAGVEATCDYLENQTITEDHLYLFKNKDKLREIYTENEIEEFSEWMKEEFPDRIEVEETTTLFSRAIEFGDEEEGKRLFRLLEEEQLDAQTLYHYAKDIKDYEKSIYYQSKHLEKAKSAQDKVSSLRSISILYCLSNDYIRAFETAKRWDQMLDELSIWKEIGLGRMLTETWFDICLGLDEQNNRKLAFNSFDKGNNMLNQIKNHPLNLLKKANMCCKKFGTPNQQSVYMRLLEEEQKRIEMFMK
ncbi:hypothetical protein [Shimazuella kribbensis]|uniref:hypothetical protein n=1 Tax=Shimazuella kribbensis TaxID=139808 RepID=UPI00041E1E7E|nr:hypothetical protein [Shimazuella kribbensis]